MAYNYLAFNGNSFFRGNANNIGYAFTGMPTQMPSLSPANYAVFKFGGNTLSYPRVNYQVGSFGADSSLMRFRKGSYDSGIVSIANSSNMKSLLSGIGSRFNLTGVIDMFEPTVEKEAKSGKKRSVEEIINLILNYGAKAVEIAKGLGMIKSNTNNITGAGNLEDDGWGNVETGEYPTNELPQERKMPAENGSTILGVKTENILIGTGVLIAGIALFKK